MIDKEKKGRSEAGQKYAADGHPRDADAEWRRRESEMTLNREFYDRIDLDSLVNLIDLYRPEFTPFGNEAAATPSPHAAQDVASLVSGRPHRGGVS